MKNIVHDNVKESDRSNDKQKNAVNFLQKEFNQIPHRRVNKRRTVDNNINIYLTKIMNIHRSPIQSILHFP